MGIKERKQRAKNSLRQSILDAAHDMLVAEGYDHISMRKLADKLEYSPTTLYLHFKDKRDLFTHLMARYFAKLKAALARARDPDDDPLTQLKKGIRAYILCGLQNPNYYRLGFMIAPPIARDEYLLPGNLGTELYAGLRASVAQCVRRGLFRPLDIDTATQILWTMNHGITSLLISNPNFPWVARKTLIAQDVECTLAAFRA